MQLKIWFKELRAEFLTASVIPVLMAVAVARFETGEFEPILFVMTLAGAVFLHLGTNVANDYFDHLSGNDYINTDYVRPFTGGSRLIQEGLIQPRTVLLTSVSFFAAATVIGIVLIVLRGPLIIVFGLAGLISGYFYVAPPLRIAHHGFGELVVGINFGLLTVMGAYYVQTGTVSAGCIVASLPLTFLITSVILINEFQDSTADARVGKRTLVVRFGNKRSVILFSAVSLASYPPIIIGVLRGLLPSVTLISLATLPLILKAIVTARIYHSVPSKLAPANASTILGHMFTGLLLMVGYLIIR